MFYNFIYGLVRAAFAPFFRIKVSGRENLPEGAALVCANHTSATDPIFLAFGLGMNVHPCFMAKAELFSVEIFGNLLRRLGAFPIRRGKADISAIKHSLGALKGGSKLILFPEGTRASEGEMLEARAGTGMLALRSGAPVVPVYITAQKRLFGRVNVKIGAPYMAQCEGKPGHQDYQNVADEIMKEINSLKEASGL